MARRLKEFDGKRLKYTAKEGFDKDGDDYEEKKKLEKLKEKQTVALSPDK